MDTGKEEPVEEKPVEMVMVEMHYLLEDLKLKVDLVDKVFQVQDILVETVTQEDNKTLQLLTVEEVVPATSVVKVVLLMLEEDLVVLDSAEIQSILMTDADSKSEVKD